MPRTRSHTAGLLAVLLLLIVVLPAAYMGTYYALLVGKRALTIEEWISGAPVEPLPEYRFDDPVVNSGLAPAHQVDRFLRGEYWSER